MPSHGAMVPNTRLFNAFQHFRRQFIQIGVSCRGIGIAVHHGNHRAAQLFVRMAHRFVQRTFQRAIITFKDWVEMRATAGTSSTSTHMLYLFLR